LKSSREVVTQSRTRYQSHGADELVEDSCCVTQKIRGAIAVPASSDEIKKPAAPKKTIRKLKKIIFFLERKLTVCGKLRTDHGDGVCK
jgi:inner membrane protein involved in colicin E2 resistance